MVDDIQKRIGFWISYAGQVIASLHVQNATELDVPNHTGFLPNPDETQFGFQADDDDGAVVWVLVLVDGVLVETANPCAIALFDLAAKGRTELGQSVECEGAIAKDTRLANQRQQQDLLDAGDFSRQDLWRGVCGFVPGCENIFRLI